MGGSPPSRTRQTQRGKRGTPSTALHPLFLHFLQPRPQSPHQHHSTGDNGSGASSRDGEGRTTGAARELASRLRAKSAAGGRPAPKGEAAAAAAPGLCGQVGRVPRGALGHPGRQDRVLRQRAGARHVAV